MPRRLLVTPAFEAALREQDHLVTRAQALAGGLSSNALQYLVEEQRWRRVLPRVYAATSADLSPRQQMIAALLYGGPSSGLDGLTVLRCHGLRYLPNDPRIRIVVPAARQVTTREFVVVRRTRRLLRLEQGAPLRRVLLPDAVIAASFDQALPVVRAMVTEVVQRGLTSYDDLANGMEHSGRSNAALLQALDDVSAGCRSTPEAEFRDLVLTSDRLPEPRWNQWLALSNGTVLGCADGYWDDAALVHEVDGRDHHFWSVDNERTDERHGTYTAAGLTVMHSSPRRIRREGTALLAGLEAAYAAGRRRGRAADVVMIDPPSWARHR